MSKRLELVWPNKDKILLGLDERGKPIWGTKDDLEPRLLVQLEAVGQTNPDNLDELYEQGDNLLIKGDNLLALKALERHFAGKIKCIYIDPPFNTGNAFEHYDDGLEHTIWLSMMKARIEMLYNLLRQDGCICIHLNAIEQPYLRLLLNESRFGRSNFLTQVSWQRAASTTVLGQGQSVINDVTEYIIIYAKDISKLQPKSRLIKKMPIEAKTLQQYNLVLEDPGRRERIDRFDDIRGNKVEIFKHHSYRIRRISLAGLNNRFDDILNHYRTHFNNIFRCVNPQRENTTQQLFISRMNDDGLYSVTYTPVKGQKAGNEITLLYFRKNIVYWLREFASLEEDGMIYKHFPMNNFWTASEIPVTGIANEGGVELKRGKKPERLIQRILEIFTSPGDWVLDSFLGSGTTAAVAHKLGRKWIGIEIGDHAETHCLPRLKRVVSGEDQTGISKQVGWKGGGGFRYCVLGESLFAKDRDTGLVMINPQYTNGLLVAAVCNLEDFRLNNDSVFHGVRGNIYAHITEEKVTQAYLDSLVERLPNGKSLTIYCLKRATDLKMPPEVKVKRIPKELQIPRYLTNSGKEARNEHSL